MATAWAVFFDEWQPYGACARLQQRLVEARQQDHIPDVVLFVEHPPVITLGRRGRDNHVVSLPGHLKADNIEVVRAGRGGDVTYHAPGQLVMYPILRLMRRGGLAHGYLHALEEIAIRTTGDFGVKARRREGKSGAWSEKGKLAAIGFRVQRSVTSHGMSFNVNPDLSGFRHIVPCGLAGEPVTSLEEHLGNACPPISGVRAVMTTHFAGVMDREVTLKTPEELLALCPALNRTVETAACT
ncbi:MAG: lipoyl(octanoyl) transferase LipB [Spartobacteria bacterium]|nr:lipoyl(octanoyl) transferase LipB [Spartobacteria bacterium]